MGAMANIGQQDLCLDYDMFFSEEAEHVLSRARRGRMNRRAEMYESIKGLECTASQVWNDVLTGLDLDRTKGCQR